MNAVFKNHSKFCATLLYQYPLLVTYTWFEILSSKMSFTERFFHRNQDDKRIFRHKDNFMKDTPSLPKKAFTTALIIFSEILFLGTAWATIDSRLTTDSSSHADADVSAKSGFYLPEPYTEASMSYANFNNLIILPVLINGNMPVNLILDTGTRNIVLFGKRFEKFFQFVPKKKVQFSGMGSGEPVYGKLSIGNRVELTSVIGERIPIVVVPNKNIFGSNSKIDGIIGYDIFQRFEVEINPTQQRIAFRPSTSGKIPEGYTRVPMRIVNTKPIIDSNVVLANGTLLKTDLMIDTGSQLSLLLKTTNTTLAGSDTPKVLGKGMSGMIEGIKTSVRTLSISGLNFQNQSTGIILSSWHNYGSIGMGLLKEYSIIINYNEAYVCLKRS
jgi:hypothetical protein